MKHANIWAVGRNYINHAKEMNAQVPTVPLFFLKAGSCLLFDKTIQLPTWSKNIHHEIELAFLIDDHLKISHVALALDLTEREAQSEAKKNGTPWTLSKSFKQACPLSDWVPYHNEDPLFFELSKNQVIVQSGEIKDMVFKPEFLLDYALQHFPVVSGDILLSGTPEGVGPISHGDQLTTHLWKNSSKESLILSCHWNVK